MPSRSTFPPSDAEKASTRADLDKMQGTWRASSIENDGRKLTAKQIEGRTLVEVNPLRFLTGGKVVSEYTITSDANCLPKEIDLASGKESSPGIYQLDGDEFKLCMNTKSGGERPGEWAAKAGSGRTLMVLNRVTP